MKKTSLLGQSKTFVCPICSASVKVDADKCPNCGVAFYEER